MEISPLRRVKRRSDSKCPHGDEFQKRRMLKVGGVYKPTIYCAQCVRDRMKIHGRWYRKHHPDKAYACNRNARERALDLIGRVCSCCGSADRPTLDHIKPRETWQGGAGNAREALKHPELFQTLCHSCNRWKNEGPFCPCKMWRETGWLPCPVKHRRRQQRKAA